MAPPGRTQGFKKVMDATDLRRYREETTLTIRKNRRDEKLRKKRLGIRDEPSATNTTSNFASGVSFNDKLTTNAEKISNVMNVYQTWMRDQTFVTTQQLLDCTRVIRRMLSTEKNPPVQEVLTAGVLPFLVEMCKDPDSILVFEAEWALTNIASTDMTDAVYRASGVIDILKYNLCEHNDPNVREQAAWCIGNIAGDKVAYRDALLEDEFVVTGMIKNLNDPVNHKLLQNVCWAVSNLCRGEPQPPMSLVRKFIRPLTNVIRQSLDQINTMDCKLEDVITDAVWCLTYLSNGDDARIQAVIDEQDIIACMNEIIKIEGADRTLLIAAIRVLGNFVSGTHDQTSSVVNSGTLKLVRPLLDHPSKLIRKEICWMLSNVAAGTEQHIWAIFYAASGGKIVEMLCDMASEDELCVKKEAIWAVCNIFTQGCEDQFNALIQFDGVRPLCKALDSREEVKILLIAMDAIEQVLLVNEKQKQQRYDDLIDEFGGIDKLESLQDHASDEVYNKAVHILERFFGGDDEEDQNLVPAANDSGFEFSVPKQLFPESNIENPFFNFGTSNISNMDL